MLRSGFVRVALAVSLAALVGCGGGSGGGTPDGPDGGGGGGGGGGDAGGGGGGGELLPLAVGNSWTYQVVDTGTGSQGTKVQSVEAFEDVGGDLAGTMAFRLHTSKPGGKYTISWQQDDAGTVVRVREQNFAAGDTEQTEQYYDPNKLRVDGSSAHTAANASFTVTYSEHVTDFTAGGATTDNNKTEQWTVMAVDESLTTPAGTFACLHLHRTDSATGSDKQYWFAEGVGKVKEEGGGQTEVLSDYTLP